MLRLRGGRALSPFRLQKLTSALKTEASQVSHISAEYWYFCAAARELHKEETAILEQLLKSVPRPDLIPAAEMVLVVPRPGTISPWSSKATDIARNCGLEAVERLERGVAFYVKTAEPAVGLTAPIRRALLPLIHDRMTESVFASLDDAEKLFRCFPPAPLRAIDVLTGGREELDKANSELGLALSPDEIGYFEDYFLRNGRNPSDVE